MLTAREESIIAGSQHISRLKRRSIRSHKATFRRFNTVGDTVKKSRSCRPPQISVIEVQEIFSEFTSTYWVPFSSWLLKRGIPVFLIYRGETQGKPFCTQLSKRMAKIEFGIIKNHRDAIESIQSELTVPHKSRSRSCFVAITHTLGAGSSRCSRIPSIATPGR